MMLEDLDGRAQAWAVFESAFFWFCLDRASTSFEDRGDANFGMSGRYLEMQRRILDRLPLRRDS